MSIELDMTMVILLRSCESKLSISGNEVNCNIMPFLRPTVKSCAMGNKYRISCRAMKINGYHTHILISGEFT